MPPAPTSSEPLGIIAGGGPLPFDVATAAHRQGRAVFVVGLEGFVDAERVASWPNRVLRVGAIGAILAELRAHDCRDLVMIGTVRRPGLRDLRPDATGLRIVAKLGKAFFGGDDGLLAGLVRLLGEEGFRVVGAHDIVGDLLAPSGVLTHTEPDDTARADIARGIVVARALGAVDVGQGCVVQQGFVLAVEAVEGTDAMLARCAGLARSGVGGVLVKLVKPGQERRADLPTVGVETVRGAAAAGLRGIAYEAGGTLLANRDAAVAAANAAGLFLIGIDPKDQST